MGNLYSYIEKPERLGKSPYTRSGLPPPKLAKKSGSDAPSHRIHDPMSLELHMGDERMRTAGMSAPEREWRKTWLKDQHLHPDEPVHVDAVYRQLNPIRVFYRWPWDQLYTRFLRPTFGVYYGSSIRIYAPKLMIGYFCVCCLYYIWKYETKDWQRKGGMMSYAEDPHITKREEIEEKHPGALAIGLHNPADRRWYEPNFHKRYTMLNVGETNRPW